jgi:hypothetical protein
MLNHAASVLKDSCFVLGTAGHSPCMDLMESHLREEGGNLGFRFSHSQACKSKLLLLVLTSSSTGWRFFQTSISHLLLLFTP